MSEGGNAGARAPREPWSQLFPRLLGVLFLALLSGVSPGCSGGGSEAPEVRVSSRSYKGHENDQDADNLVGAYPAIVGTRLDDCQTCHSGRMEEGKLAGSSCDHCHDLLLSETGNDASGTLNGFGRDYLDAGRSMEGLKSIGENDSDGDGFPNEDEVAAGRYPGSEQSRPGQAAARVLTVTLDELKGLPSYTQFMLLNNTQQQFDDYVTFTGVTVEELLHARNIDLAGATGITVIAPDGYMKSLPVGHVGRVFPQPIFYSGLDEESLGAGCGLVSYPETIPPGVSDGSPLPGQHGLLLAYERNGMLLDPTRMDVTEGKIRGEGPLRIVVPQENPGMPDRGTRFSPSGCGDGLDFKPEADHNAGSMVRGVIAIRIDPMPAGVEEFDYMNGGWAFIDAGQLIIYGHGIG